MAPVVLFIDSTESFALFKEVASFAPKDKWITAPGDKYAGSKFRIPEETLHTACCKAGLMRRLRHCATAEFNLACQSVDYRLRSLPQPPASSPPLRFLFWRSTALQNTVLFCRVSINRSVDANTDLQGRSDIFQLISICVGNLPTS